MKTIKTASGKIVNIDNVDKEIWEAIGLEYGWLRTAEGANEMQDNDYAEELPDPNQEDFGENSDTPNPAPPLGETVKEVEGELANKDNPDANIAEWREERQAPPDMSTIDQVNNADNQQREDRQMKNKMESERMDQIEQQKQNDQNDQNNDIEEQIEEIEDMAKNEELTEQITENINQTIQNTVNTISLSNNIITFPKK
jgi:hypothetical protein